MASSWLNSWGSAWGVSWGSNNVAQTTGGGDIADPLYYNHWRRVREREQAKVNPPKPAAIVPEIVELPDNDDDDVQALLLVMHELALSP
jgi:hypothetical protein